MEPFEVLRAFEEFLKGWKNERIELNIQIKKLQVINIKCMK